MAQSPQAQLFALCNACGRYPCFRGKALCPKCMQRCHDASSTADTALCVLDERSPKFTVIKQTFLSRWYGHGGCGARVEQVVALFLSQQYNAYIAYQKKWYAAKLAQGIVDPFLNERRLYVPVYPHFTCNQFLPPASRGTPTSSSAPPAGSGLGWQPTHHVSNSAALVNRPVSPCQDPACELCQWLLNGLPQRSLGRTGSCGLAHYLSYEPTAVARPADTVQKAEVGRLANDLNQERRRRICVLCRVVVGQTHWCSECTPVVPAGCDSLLVEKNALSDVVIPEAAAVLPVFLIVCSSEY